MKRMEGEREREKADAGTPHFKVRRNIDRWQQNVATARMTGVLGDLCVWYFNSSSSSSS
jgi:hypothetical protein